MRRGSALLIVLGMLAFMVSSAVGFAIYMREGRAPSSHLRRESTARYLLKSALANAVAGIDGTYSRQDGGFIGVHDDVYPGVSSSGLSENQNGNVWRHRVFTPFGAIDQRDTVSTLTLEALAYLPPAIVNEVRVFSRTTRTAKWHNLSYDLGRYAYIAVDVSDCFDINKVYAGERRSSAAGQRVNLSSLYPNNGSALDDLFDKAGNVPFVSLADFNIVAGKSEYTPFMKYVGSTGAKIYTQDDVNALSNALFITDTWFPATNQYLTADLKLRERPLGGKVFDLAEKQPFLNFDVGDFAHFVTQSGMDESGPFLRNLGGVGMACLYDYLDRDSIPMSLALPTVEVAPMICGVSLVGTATAMSPVFEKSDLPDVNYELSWNGNDYKIKRKIAKYAFKGMNNPQSARIVGAALYPFKRLQKTGRAAGKSFKVVPLVAMFYAPDDLPARLENTTAFRTGKTMWDNPQAYNGVCWYVGDPKALSLPSDDLCSQNDEQNQENAVIEFNVGLKPASTDIDMPVCHFVNETAEPKPLPDGTMPPPLPEATLERDKLTLDGILDGGNKDNYFRPFQKNGDDWKLFGDKNGSYQKLLTAQDRQDGKMQNAAPAGTWRLYYAVWLRVVDSADKTVDMVPAVFGDDANWLEENNFGKFADNAQFTALNGDGAPLLPFRASQATEFKYDQAALDEQNGSKPVDFDNWKALYAIDPRYNFAPEDWKGVGENFNNKSDWRQRTAGYLGAAGRDRDVFMFTSDQEYLQSIGELQFLPFVQRLGENAQFLEGDFKNLSRYNGVVGSFANGERFWKSYTSVQEDNEERNPFLDMYDSGNPVEFISGKGDFRINPFSPDPRIIGAAVVDTPYDYYVASTNPNCNVNADMSPAKAQQLAFGEKGACGTWMADEVSDIAERMRSSFLDAASRGNSDMTAIVTDYRHWNDANRKRIFGIGEDLDYPLNDVDRKFLCSFWRECFQNRQQLFLLFIRAEPLTVGGSTGDAIANAQLGARGVALVWRDPAPPRGVRRPRQVGSMSSDENERKELLRPHRTRVLFYHQFD